jgi:hypothetical protein
MLELKPLEIEGGFFRQTYRSDETVAVSALPQRYGGGRVLGTAIYYLLTPQVHSRLHRLKSDEIFHFLLGDPVEMLQLRPDGTSAVTAIGPDLAAGEQLQVVVARGTWQGSLLRPGGRWALMGVTVAPGFDYADYESADARALVEEYPRRRDLICLLAAPSGR